MSADGAWPAAWRRRRGAIVGLLVLMGLVVAAAVDAAVGGDSARDGRALIMLGIAPAVVAIGVVIAMQHLVPRRFSAAAVRTSPADEWPVPGLAFPYRRGLAIARAVAAVVVLVLGVVLLLAGVLGLARGMGGAVAALLLGVIAVVGAAGPLVPVVTGRWLRAAVILTPDGVVHRSPAGDVVVPWVAVIDVVPVGAVPAGIAIVCRPSTDTAAPIGPAVSGDGSQPRSARRRRRWLDPTARFLPDVVVPGLDLAVHPVLALRLARFYAHHSELRDELGTSSAITRAHAMTAT